MNRFTLRFLIRLFVAVGVLWGASGLASLANEVPLSALEGLDLKKIAPTNNETTGFELKYKDRDVKIRRIYFDPQVRFPAAKSGEYVGSSKACSFTYKREIDGLLVDVELFVATTPAATREWLRLDKATEQIVGGFPEGLPPSGRTLGQRSWHSRPEPDGGMPSDYGLRTLDGLSLVKVTLMQTRRKVVNGTRIDPRLTQADLLMAEKIARGCLARLRAQGFTSEPPPAP